MGRSQRDKGARGERIVVEAARGAGLDAERIPLSGAMGTYKGDVRVTLDRPRTVEVKLRADGFREIYRWLEGADLLVLKADRRPLLVVLPAQLALELYRKGQSDA